jgi:S1-C subfamily serine protease
MMTKGGAPRAIIFALLCVCIPFCDKPAVADNVHQEVRRRLVSIGITGESNAGDPLASEGTGVLVSSDGYILTSYHLFDSVASAKPGSVVISISIGEKKDNRDRRAFLVDAKPNIDVALLKTPTASVDYPFANIGTTRDIQIGDGFFVSGFPSHSVAAPQIQSMQLSSFDGPGGHTWLLSGQVDPAQSGSPVYRADGSIVGVIKGVVGTQTAFIPVDLADILVLPLRFRDLEERLKALSVTVKQLSGAKQ